MRKLSLDDLEVELMDVISRWRTELMEDDDVVSVADIDAGDGAKLASEIAVNVIGHGVGIKGKWVAHRKLNDGWRIE